MFLTGCLPACRDSSGRMDCFRKEIPSAREQIQTTVAWELYSNSHLDSDNLSMCTVPVPYMNISDPITKFKWSSIYDNNEAGDWLSCLFESREWNCGAAVGI